MLTYFKINLFLKGIAFLQELLQAVDCPITGPGYPCRIWAITQALGPSHQEPLSFVSLLPSDFISMVISLPQTLIITFLHDY